MTAAAPCVARAARAARLARVDRVARIARAGLAAVAVAVLAGCASVTPATPDPRDTAHVGRLAMRVDADGDLHPSRAFSAGFDLRGGSARGTLALSTPLGSTLAQARWAPGEVLLETPSSTRRYPDLASLTQDVLGESVPVEAWFDWLRGAPWTGAASEPLGDGRDGGFTQLGWQVRPERDAASRRVSAVVAVRRAPPPTVTVRIRLD